VELIRTFKSMPRRIRTITFVLQLSRDIIWPVPSRNYVRKIVQPQEKRSQPNGVEGAQVDFTSLV